MIRNKMQKNQKTAVMATRRQVLAGASAFSLFALGQAAATAASLAVDCGCAVQDVDYGRLRERLLKDGQRLSIK